jgi:hypothetical protein
MLTENLSSVIPGRVHTWTAVPHGYVPIVHVASIPDINRIVSFTLEDDCQLLIKFGDFLRNNGTP